MVEVLASIVLLVIILAVMLPMLYSLRFSSRMAECQMNQLQIGFGWMVYLSDHDVLPHVTREPGWKFAGVQFAPLTDQPQLDFSRPLNHTLLDRWRDREEGNLFRSPLDTGIIDPAVRSREYPTTYRAKGISYRANDYLLNAALARIDTTPRPLRPAEITADHSSVILMGAPIWWEVVHNTGRSANWYRQRNTGLMLFFDGSVRLATAAPNGFDNPEATVAPQPGLVSLFRSP